VQTEALADLQSVRLVTMAAFICFMALGISNPVARKSCVNSSASMCYEKHDCNVYFEVYELTVECTLSHAECVLQSPVELVAIYQGVWFLKDV
jgi:hypothetical protein